MKYSTATVEVTLPNGTVEAFDLEAIDSEAAMVDELWAMYRAELGEDGDENEEEREDFTGNLTFSNPQGFAVHLFNLLPGQAFATPAAWYTTADSFDDILSAWNDETDDDRREAMGEYLDDMGADDLSDFDEAYQGQYRDGAAFAQEHCEGCGVISDEFPAWVCIDWEATWERGLRFDYTITDSGHVFRNL